MASNLSINGGYKGDVIFTGSDGLAKIIKNIKDTRWQIITANHLNEDRNFVDRVINSSELNKVIKMGKS